MTFAFGDVVDVPVKIGFSFYIAINLFMTVAAEFALLTSVKNLVAFFAFFLKARMSVHEFAGHDEVLHALDRIDTCITMSKREEGEKGR